MANLGEDECIPEHGRNLDLVLSCEERIAELLSLTKSRLNDPLFVRLNTCTVVEWTHLYLLVLLRKSWTWL